MAAPRATTCAACGASGELQEHHLIPRVHGGVDLPTVMLCLACHGLVHGRETNFNPNHRELTKAGLAAAKARGVKFGRLSPGARRAAVRGSRKSNMRRARLQAATIMPHIEAARASGATTLNLIAKALTANGIATVRGKGVWRAQQVKRVIALAALDPDVTYIRPGRATYLPAGVAWKPGTPDRGRA